MELDKEVENLAPAAIRKGSYMTMPMLVFFAENLQVCHARSKKQEGSGKGGSLKKEDYAWAAVQFSFPKRLMRNSFGCTMAS